jgi:hypothetical protein
MAKSSKVADLLKVLGQKTPTLAPARKPEAPKSAMPPARPAAARKPKAKAAGRGHAIPSEPTRGKAVQLYLHDQDQKLIRELAVWLAPHRKRINDSLVVKTALRAAKTGPELLAAYDDAVKVDGRTRRRGPKDVD